MFKSYHTKKNDGLALILTLLIISSILTGTVLVADTIIRHAQIILGAEISEKSYFSAKTAIQKAAYQYGKNYVDVYPEGTPYSLDGTLYDGKSDYTATIVIDTECPNPGTECDSGAISNTNAWTISLSAGESFQLDIDINGATYPNSIQITRSGLIDTDIIIYECTTTVGSPRNCSTMSQTFNISFPYTFDISSYASKYYKLRIKNIGSSSESYTLTPDGTLPIGVEISATGSYLEYERRLKSNIPKWQKFGY